MANPKQIRFVYQAKNNTTGLADVKAQIYLNGVAKAVGGSAIVATEVDATNSPGLYEIVLSTANLTTWGVTAGATNVIEAYVNSATHSAFAPFREVVTFYNIDDVEATLGTPAGASVSADIAAVKSDTAAVKVDLESGPHNLSLIHAAIQAIQNNAGFAVPVPAQLIIPAAGSNTYRIPVTIYNEVNALADADSNTITVALANQAGTSRNSYLASTTMTRDSLGQYHVDLSIPNTAPVEELLFTFSYAIGGAATARRAVTETISDFAASGFALQSTLLSVQSDVSTIKSDIEDGSTGLVAIKAAVDAIQTDITSNVEGTGFDNSTDSLREISVYMRANLFIGGRAV